MRKKIYIYTNNIIYMRHTWICSYELLQQLKKKIYILMIMWHTCQGKMKLCVAI